MLKQKVAAEKAKSSKLHLVTSTPEFESSLNIIKEEGLPPKKEEKKLLDFLKEQVQIRKKLLQQKTNITFTRNGKNCPLNVLIEEVRDLIVQLGKHSTQIRS